MNGKRVTCFEAFKHGREFQSDSGLAKHVQRVRRGDKQSFTTWSRLSLELKSFETCSRRAGVEMCVTCVKCV